MKKPITLLSLIFPPLVCALPPVECLPADRAEIVRQCWLVGEGNFATHAGWTGSMRPYIDGGELLLMQKYSGQKIEPGMLLVFARWDKPLGVVHECVEVSATHFRAKGIYNIDDDGWYPLKRIKFVVWRVLKTL